MAPRVGPKYSGVNPVFDTYVSEYRELIGKNDYQWRFDNLSINFVELESPAIGRCWWLLSGDVEIEIDAYWWESTNARGKQFLMYHELEHCIRRRFHTDKPSSVKNKSDFLEEIIYRLGLKSKFGYLRDGCPISLMHPNMVTSRCREKHYWYYMTELKEWGKTR
jgi:hypothetical protein